MKITIEQLNEKQAILRRVDTSVNDKLTYAVKKISQQIQRALKPIQEAASESINDKTIDLASTDDKKNLITEEIAGQAQYVFTPDNKKALNTAIKVINADFNSTQIEIDGYIIDITNPDYSRAIDLFDYFEREELQEIVFPVIPLTDTGQITE